jgi:hypothetical protein
MAVAEVVPTPLAGARVVSEAQALPTMNRLG